MFLVDLPTASESMMIIMTSMMGTVTGRAHDLAARLVRSVAIVDSTEMGTTETVQRGCRSQAFGGRQASNAQESALLQLQELAGQILTVAPHAPRGVGQLPTANLAHASGSSPPRLNQPMRNP